VAIRPLLESAGSRSAVLATFLAVLELVRLNVAQLRQDRPFGEILLRRHRRFHEAWEQAQAASKGGSLEIADPTPASPENA